VIVQE